MEWLFVCSGDPGARLQVRQSAGKVTIALWGAA
jgi:hypothetical protein